MEQEKNKVPSQDNENPGSEGSKTGDLDSDKETKKNW